MWLQAARVLCAAVQRPQNRGAQAGEVPLTTAIRVPGRRASASQLALLCALACAGHANAQFSRLADEIEWKRLDVHPRPTLLKDPGLGVYGRVDLGLVRREFGTSNEFRCRRERVGTRWALDSVSRSHIGWHQDAPLGSGLNVHLRLEHSFDASRGRLANDCKVFFDAAQSVAISHQDWGRIELGRRDQPAWQVALLADPWGGSSVGSPGPKHYRTPPVRDGLHRMRTDRALTLQSRDLAGLRIDLQASLPEGDGPGVEHGGAWWYDTGNWRLAIGWQRWDSDNQALPMAAVWQVGMARLHLGHTSGRVGGARYRSALVALSVEERSGARRGEWRWGLNHQVEDGKASITRLSLGHVLPLNRRVAVYFNGAVQQGRGRTDAAVDFGFRQAFSL